MQRDHHEMAQMMMATADSMLMRIRQLLLALYAPLRLFISLIDLYLHLRARPQLQKTAVAKCDEFAELLAKLPTIAEPWVARIARKSEKWAGRGIVVIAGGTRYGQLACELVRSLRRTGCDLPIEIFHLGRAELECEAMDTLAAMDGVTLRDLLSGQPTLLDEPGFGYAAKPLALTACSFDEALLLDADNAVLRDPTSLFDAPAYHTHGAVFWNDMYAGDEKFVRLIDPWGIRHRPGVFEMWIQVQSRYISRRLHAISSSLPLPPRRSPCVTLSRPCVLVVVGAGFDRLAADTSRARQG